MAGYSSRDGKFARVPCPERELVYSMPDASLLQIEISQLIVFKRLYGTNIPVDDPKSGTPRPCPLWRVYE